MVLYSHTLALTVTNDNARQRAGVDFAIKEIILKRFGYP